MARPPAPPAPPAPNTAGAQGTAAPRWQLRLLGDTALTTPTGASLRLPGPVATLMLARLAMHPGRAHPREALIDLLWPGVGLDVGRNRLRQLLATLKRALAAGGAGDDLLQADRLSVRLQSDVLDCDVVRFEAHLAAGRPQAAMVTYGGELMPGYFEDWVHEERLRLAALADKWATAGATAAQPAPAAPRPGDITLPHYLTRLYGVDAWVQDLQAAINVHRLVTLLGPGGHGKTRLAVEVARAQQPDHFDLVAFVPLVTCAEGPDAPESLLAALLLALHQTASGPSSLAHLQRLMSGRRTLLVLDNAEQVAQALAHLVADLLARCPGLHLLVTSRRPLGVDGEQQRPVPALPLPSDTDDTDEHDGSTGAGLPARPIANPAVALFMDRARAAAPAFDLQPGQMAPVAALVRHLQGMPLAIELAASHMGSLSPASVLHLLQSPAQGQEGNVLRLLARPGPRAGSDPRHASMLAVVQWSWRLLSPTAQHLLPRLSVIPGSFSLSAAVALADTPALDTTLALQELVAHSMLHAGPVPDRFSMFELIREFAASELTGSAQAALRERHRQWLTRWFQHLPLSTPLAQVRQELPNLCAALAGAEVDRAYRQAADLAQAAQAALSAVSLPAPGLAALERCAMQLTDPGQQAVTLAGLARSLLLAGQAQRAGQLALQALACLPADQTGLPRAWVLTRAAHVLWRLARDERAAGWLDEALALARQAQATALQATILTNLGALARRDRPTHSIALQRQAVALWAEAGDTHGVSVGRCNLALALLTTRAGAAEAVALAGQAMRDTRLQGDDLQHALACNLYGEAWSRLGQWDRAAQAYRQCLATAYAAAEPWPQIYGLWNLPRALAHLRQPEAAAELMGFVEGHSLAVTGPHSDSDRRDLRRLRRLCAVQAGPAQTRTCWRRGADLRLGAAVRLALHGSTRAALPP